MNYYSDPNGGDPNKKPKKKHTGLKIAAFVMAMVLVSGGSIGVYEASALPMLTTAVLLWQAMILPQQMKARAKVGQRFFQEEQFRSELDPAGIYQRLDVGSRYCQEGDSVGCRRTVHVLFFQRQYQQ